MKLSVFACQKLFSFNREIKSKCLAFPDKYLKNIPKSPVRELLEQEPETAKFE